MTRGVGKQILFEDDTDHIRYLNYLYKYVSKNGHVEILAWCLMDNHVHLLLRATLNDLALVMQQLNTAYARWFNERYQRIGALFQGRFRSEPVDDDRYLITVLRYIHQNPVRARLSRDCSYRWSSYDAYLESAIAVRNIRSWVMDLFGGIEGFVEFHRTIDGSIPSDLRKLRSNSDVNKKMIAKANRAIYPLRISEVRGLTRQERNTALLTLVRSGLSLRQVERLTGVSKSLVSLAVKAQSQQG